MSFEQSPNEGAKQLDRKDWILSGITSVAIFGLIGAGLYENHPVESIVSYMYAVGLGAAAIVGCHKAPAK